MSVKKKTKGLFTNLGLSISKKYIRPVTRNEMLLGGLFGGAVILAFYLFSTFFMANTFISSGPLSSNHAVIETDCSACHAQFESVSDSKCSDCHDLKGSSGRIYDFNAHYIYRSEDISRRTPAKEEFASKELNCFSCHPEHRGREASILKVPSSKCTRCHDFSFDEHPDFSLPPDNESLEFTHVQHIKGYIGSKNPNAECESCHRLNPDGKHFGAMTYKKDCAECHREHLDGFPHGDERALNNSRNNCQICHRISGRSVEPILPEKSVLIRSEFNHGAHLLVAQCLDCHREIPIIAEIKAPISADKAGTQNLPKIKSCQDCHNPSEADNNCTTCHAFHPNKYLKFTAMIQ